MMSGDVSYENEEPIIFNPEHFRHALMKPFFDLCTPPPYNILLLAFTLMGFDVCNGSFPSITIVFPTPWQHLLLPRQTSVLGCEKKTPNFGSA